MSILFERWRDQIAARIPIRSVDSSFQNRMVANHAGAILADECAWNDSAHLEREIQGIIRHRHQNGGQDVHSHRHFSALSLTWQRLCNLRLFRT